MGIPSIINLVDGIRFPSLSRAKNGWSLKSRTIDPSNSIKFEISNLTLASSELAFKTHTFLSHLAAFILFVPLIFSQALHILAVVVFEGQSLVFIKNGFEIVILKIDRLSNVMQRDQ